MEPRVRQRNIFGIFTEIQRVPFAVSRKNWKDTDYVVVTRVEPKGDYGIAYGFPVRDEIPNDHFNGYREWEEKMVIPNAGAYQWRIIDVTDSRLRELNQIFAATIATEFEFGHAMDQE